MGRKLGLMYAGANYLLFLAVYFYLIGFLINFGVPKSIDTGASNGALWAAIVDTALLASFGVQHSVMARQWFKRWWTKLIPKSLERSTYVLISNLMMILMFWQWQPIPHELWRTESHLYQLWWYTAYAMGALFVPVSTLFINHFDLFGLRQVWLNYRGAKYTGMKFATPGPYKVVRHPLYVGWLVSRP